MYYPSKSTWNLYFTHTKIKSGKLLRITLYDLQNQCVEVTYIMWIRLKGHIRNHSFLSKYKICQNTNLTKGPQSTHTKNGKICCRQIYVYYIQGFVCGPKLFACWVFFACFLSSADFSFKINDSKKNISGLPSECQTVLTQIRPDSMLYFLQLVIISR